MCRECLLDLPWQQPELCPQCALPTFNSELCGNCLDSSPDFDSTHALFSYDFPVDSMLQRYKYGNSLPMADMFGQLLVHAFGERSPQSAGRTADLIIPMPLHPQRLRERGFNQSLEIARILSSMTGVKLDSQICIRTKLSPPQASLPLKHRVGNMKGAFKCKSRLDGLNVILIDDVMTTGASLNALAKAVKSAGVNHVECWVIARTLPK